MSTKTDHGRFLDAGSLGIGEHGMCNMVAASLRLRPANSVLMAYPEWTVPGRLINLSLGDMLKNVSSPLYCAAGMSAAVLVLGVILPGERPHWANLAVQVPFGAGVYAVLIHVFKIRAYCEVRELAIEQWRLRYRMPAEK